MIGKYFALAFVCVSLAQVQGDEVENAIKKGLLRVDALHERGIRRIESVEKYQGQLIQTKAAVFMEKIQRMQESARQTLRRTAQTAEEKAQEMQKPNSVFECISRAEKNANSQIETSAARFQTEIERLQKVYSARVLLASKPLATYKKDLNMKYERTVTEIKACKTVRCVEIAANNFSIFVERFFDAVGRVQTQISTIVSSFQREAKTAFNNTNRQMSMTQSNGLRQIRECIYRRYVFEEEQQ